MLPGRKLDSHAEPVSGATPDVGLGSTRPGDSPSGTAITAAADGSRAGADALTDLRSLWLVPTFLITVIAAVLLSAGQIPFLRVHLQPMLWSAGAIFVLIYWLVNRRSKTLAGILARHEAQLATSRDRLAAINSIGRTVAAELDLELVLKAICTATEQALSADSVIVELAPRYSAATEKPVLTLLDAGARAGASAVECPIVGPSGSAIGTIRAQRPGRPFDDADHTLLEAIAGQVTTAINNAQHYEASRRRAADLRDFVLRSADAVAASDDIGRIAALVTRQACKVVSCDGAGIFLFGEERRLLCPVASQLSDGRPVDSTRAANFYTRPIALDEATLLKAVLSSPGPLIIEDVTAFSEGRAWYHGAGIGSLVAAPIVGRVHGALGVLIVHWTERRTRANTEDSSLLGALAAFAAVAIENAKLSAAAKTTHTELSARNERLLEETQRRRAELQKLVHRVGDALVAGLSSEKVAQLVVDQVRQMIPCYQAIFWVREADDVFLPLARASEPDDAVDATGWRLNGSRFLGEVMNNAHPMVVSDVAEDCRLSSGERMRFRREDISSLLVAPLRGRGDQVIGLLALYWTSPRHNPTPEEFDTSDVLATQAAAALENAHLHMQLEEAEQRLSIQLEQTTAARDFVERILQNVQAAVFVIAADADGTILRANALAEAMPDPDRQRDGLVGRRIADVFPGIDGVVGAFIDQSIASGEPVTIVDAEYDGFERGKTYWTFSITPQRDPATRQVSQIIALALDTTDRIRLMRENERNAARVETLVRISQSLSATLEPDQIYAIVASGALELLSQPDGAHTALYVREGSVEAYRRVASAGGGQPTFGEGRPTDAHLDEQQLMPAPRPLGGPYTTGSPETSPQPSPWKGEGGGLERPGSMAVAPDRHAGADRPDVSPTLIRHLQSSCSPMVVNDPTADKVPLDDRKSGTTLLLPLVSQNAAVGHLVLTAVTPGVFSDANLVDALTNLASLSAAVIHNALAFAYEQNIAETLQKSFLPSTPAQMPGLEIAERYFPTLRDEAEIGGDYYDVIVLGPKRLALFIGDISGKGLAAAIYTAMAKYTLRAFIAQEMPPLEVVERTNVALARWIGQGLFSTLFYAVLDVETGVLTYVNAGHEPGVLLRASGTAESLEPTGPMLGVFPEGGFTVGEVSLDEGDLLTLYTDGLSDARDASGLFFAEEGIRDHVRSVQSASVDAVCDSLHKKAIEYSANHRMRDDVALLVIRVAGG